MSKQKLRWAQPGLEVNEVVLREVFVADLVVFQCPLAKVLRMNFDVDEVDGVSHMLSGRS